jgi:hypothetical protein
MEKGIKWNKDIYEKDIKRSYYTRVALYMVFHNGTTVVRPYVC